MGKKSQKLDWGHLMNGQIVKIPNNGTSTCAKANSSTAHQMPAGAGVSGTKQDTALGTAARTVKSPNASPTAASTSQDTKPSQPQQQQPGTTSAWQTPAITPARVPGSKTTSQPASLPTSATTENAGPSTKAIQQLPVPPPSVWKKTEPAVTTPGTSAQQQTSPLPSPPASTQGNKPSHLAAPKFTPYVKAQKAPYMSPPPLSHGFPTLSQASQPTIAITEDILKSLVSQVRFQLSDAGKYAGEEAVKQQVRHFLAKEMPTAILHEDVLARVIVSAEIPKREQGILAYVYSYLSARYLTTLADLADSLDSIVKTEFNVENFEKLLLGPLLKQPIIQQFFPYFEKLASDDKATWRQVRAQHVYTAFAEVLSKQDRKNQIPYQELTAKLLDTASRMFHDAPSELLGIYLQSSVRPCITFLNRNIDKFKREVTESTKSINNSCMQTWTREWPRAIKELRSSLESQVVKELQGIFQNKQEDLSTTLAMLKPLSQQHVSAAVASLIKTTQDYQSRMPSNAVPGAQLHARLPNRSPVVAASKVQPDVKDPLSFVKSFISTGEPRLVHFDKELQPALHALYVTDPGTFKLVQDFLPFTVAPGASATQEAKKLKADQASDWRAPQAAQQAAEGAGNRPEGTTLILDDKTMIEGLIRILQGLFSVHGSGGGDAAAASMHVDDIVSQLAAEELIKLVTGAAQMDERLEAVLSAYWKHDALIQLLLKAVSLWLKHGSPFKPIKEAADEHAMMHNLGSRLTRASLEELEEVINSSWKGSSITALADLERAVTEHFRVPSIAQLQLPDGHTSMIGFLRHTVDQDLTGWECSHDTGPEDTGAFRKDEVLHVVQQLQHVIRKQQMPNESRFANVIENALCVHFKVTNVLQLGYGPVKHLLEEAKHLDIGCGIESAHGSLWVALALPCKGISTLDAQTRGEQVKRALACLSAAPILSDISAWCDWPAMYETVLGPLPRFLQDHSSMLQFRYIELPGRVMLKLPHGGCNDVPTLRVQWQEAIEQDNPELFVGLLLAHVAMKGGAGGCDVAQLQSVLESLLRRAAAAQKTTNTQNNTTTTFMVRCLQLLPSPIASTLVTKLLLPSFEAALGRKANMHKQLLSAAVALDSKRTYYGYTSFSGQPSAQQRLHSLGYMFDIDTWKVEHVKQQYIPEPYNQVAVPVSTPAQKVDAVNAVLQQIVHAPPSQPNFAEVDAPCNSNASEAATTPDAPCTPTALEGEVSFFTPGNEALASKPESVAPTCIDMLAVADGSKIDTSSKQRGVEGNEQVVVTIPALQLAAPEPMTPQQELIEEIRSEYKLTPDGKADMSDKGNQRHADMMSLLAEELYATDTHFVMELVQNADDNTYKPDVTPQLEMLLTGRSAIVLNNEEGFNDKSVRGVANMGRSTKQGLADYTGQKGIGFKSVFKVTDCAAIHSNGYHFCFNSGPLLGKLGYCVPTWIPSQSIPDELPMALTHSSKLAQSMLSAQDMASPMGLLALDGGLSAIHLPWKPDLSEEIGSSLQELHPTILMFLRKLKHITVTDIPSGKSMEMCCEKEEGGVVRLFVRHWSGPAYSTLVQDVKESRWLIVTQTLYPGETRRRKYLVERTHVSIAFALDGTAPTKQGVFAFLPVEKKFGLHFIVQGDFVLTTSRADVDVSNPWNKMLASAVPSLFVQAFNKFKDPAHLPSLNDPLSWTDWWLRCVPLEEHGIEDFFASVPSEVCGMLRGMECIPVQTTDAHCNSSSTTDHTTSSSSQLKWVLPGQALICTSPELRDLFPPRQLAELGQFFVHPSIKVLHEEEGHGEALRRQLGVRKLDQQKVIELVKAQAEEGSLMRDGDMEHLQKLLLCLSTARGKQLRPLQHVPLLPVYGKPSQELHAAHIPLSDTDGDHEAGYSRLYFSPWAKQVVKPGPQTTSSDFNVAQHRQLLEVCNISLDQLAGLPLSSNDQSTMQAPALKFVDPSLLEMKTPEDVENMRKLLKDLGVQELTKDVVVSHYTIPTMKRWAERARIANQTDKGQQAAIAPAATTMVPQILVTQTDAGQLFGLLQYLLMSGKINAADFQEQAASQSSRSVLTELRNNTVVVTAQGTAALLQHDAKADSDDKADNGSGGRRLQTVFLPEQLGAKYDLQTMFPARSSAWTFVNNGYLSSQRNVPSGLRAPGKETWKALFMALGAQTFLPVVPRTVRIRASQPPSRCSSATITQQDDVSLFEYMDWECPDFKPLLDAINHDRKANQGRWRAQLCNLIVVISDVWTDWKRSGYLAAKCCSGAQNVDLNGDNLGIDIMGPVDSICKTNQTVQPGDLPSSLLQQLRDLEWLPSSEGHIYRASQLFQDTDAITRVLGRKVPFPAQPSHIDKAAYNTMLVDLGMQTQLSSSNIIDVLQSWSNSVNCKRLPAQAVPGSKPVQPPGEWVAMLSQMRALYHHLSPLITKGGDLPRDGWSQLTLGTGSDELMQRMQAWWAFSHEPLIWLPDHSALVKAINQSQESHAMDPGYDQYGGYNNYSGMMNTSTRGRNPAKAKPPSQKSAATDLLDPAKNALFLERIASIIDTPLAGRFYHAHEVCYSDHSLTLELMNVIVTANANNKQSLTCSITATNATNTGTNAGNSGGTYETPPPRILSLYYEPNCFVARQQQQLAGLFTDQLRRLGPAVSNWPEGEWWSCVGGFGGFPSHSHFCEAMQTMLHTTGGKSDPASLEYELVVRVMRSWSGSIADMLMREKAQQALKDQLLTPGCNIFPTMAGTWAHLTDNLIQPDDAAMLALFNNEPKLAFLRLPAEPDSDPYTGLRPFLRMLGIPCLSDIVHHLPPSCEEAESALEDPAEKIVTYLTASMPILQRWLLKHVGLTMYEKIAPVIAHQLSQFKCCKVKQVQACFELRMPKLKMTEHSRHDVSAGAQQSSMHDTIDDKYSIVVRKEAARTALLALSTQLTACKEQKQKSEDTEVCLKPVMDVLLVTEPDKVGYDFKAIASHMATLVCDLVASTSASAPPPATDCVNTDGVVTSQLPANTQCPGGETHAAADPQLQETPFTWSAGDQQTLAALFTDLLLCQALGQSMEVKQQLEPYCNLPSLPEACNSPWSLWVKPPPPAPPASTEEVLRETLAAALAGDFSNLPDLQDGTNCEGSAALPSLTLSLHENEEDRARREEMERQDVLLKQHKDAKLAEIRARQQQAAAQESMHAGTPTNAEANLPQPANGGMQNAPFPTPSGKTSVSPSAQAAALMAMQTPMPPTYETAPQRTAAERKETNTCTAASAASSSNAPTEKRHTTDNGGMLPSRVSLGTTQHHVGVTSRNHEARDEASQQTPVLSSNSVDFPPLAARPSMTKDTTTMQVSSSSAAATNGTKGFNDAAKGDEAKPSDRSTNVMKTQEGATSASAKVPDNTQHALSSTTAAADLKLAQPDGSVDPQQQEGEAVFEVSTASQAQRSAIGKADAVTIGKTGHHYAGNPGNGTGRVSLHDGQHGDSFEFSSNSSDVAALAAQLMGTMQIVQPALPSPPYSGDIQLLRETTGTIAVGRAGEHAVHQHLLNLQANNQLLSYFNRVHGYQAGVLGKSSRGLIGIAWVNEKTEMMRPYDILVYEYQPDTASNSAQSPQANSAKPASAALLSPRQTEPSLTALCDAIDRFEPQLDNPKSLCLKVPGTAGCVLLAAIEVKCTTDPRKAASFELSAFESECARVKRDWYQIWRLAQNTNGNYSLRQLTNPHSLWREKHVTVQMHVKDNCWDAKGSQE